MYICVYKNDVSNDTRILFSLFSMQMYDDEVPRYAACYTRTILEMPENAC